MSKRFAGQIQRKVEFETPDGSRFETEAAAEAHLALEADVEALATELKLDHWDLDLDESERDSLARWILRRFVRR